MSNDTSSSASQKQELPEFPESNELVIAVVKKIAPYGAFCILPEYKNREAFLHISEVAPRWIKNIHEFVSEGQRVVAKVHHVDHQKGQVDISLKRVSDEEKRRKLEHMNQEKRAERLIEVTYNAVKLKKPTLEEIRNKIIDEYGDLYSLLKDVSEGGEKPLENIDFPQSFKEKLVEVVKKNIKKPVLVISGTADLTCYGGSGIVAIREGITSISKSKGAVISYLGAPRYKISVTSSEYKSGEKKLSDAVASLEAFAKKNNCVFEFKRDAE
jgi:translation initiation factor 2 subunit 1